MAGPWHNRSMTVRRAEPGDAEVIHGLLAEAFAPFRSRYTDAAFAATVVAADAVRERMTEGPVWVAQLDGRTAGTVSAVRDEAGCYVRGMAVAPAGQGRGLGRLLLDAVEGHARATGASRLWLWTAPFLEAAVALYMRTGFRLTDREPDLHGTRLVEMEKALV